jgi:hypothetical protein
MKRRIGYDEVGNYKVSTVELRNNHGYNGIDLWFETMIFPINNYTEEYCDRYTTEEEAIAGHAKALEHARKLGENK